jgi:DNA-binding protein WhiA
LKSFAGRSKEAAAAGAAGRERQIRGAMAFVRDRAARIKVFSADAKDEIARAPFRRDCCPRAFLAAFAAFGSRDLRSTKSGEITLRATRVSIARAVLKAAAQVHIRAHAQDLDTRRARESLSVAVTLDVQPTAKPLIPARACCRRARIRGAFLACGSVADPTRGYHLEFNTRDDAAARAVAAGLAVIGVDAGISRRRKKPLAYVKGGQEVADLLAQMGATQTVLWLDEVRARRETKNSIRRTVNSEAANAARAGTASARQIEAATTLLRPARVHVLSEPLREAARLRRAHPDLTMSELGRRARPPVTKSSMAYRLREIERLARSRRR